MKLYNSSKNNFIADDVKVADNFITRTFGLIPRKTISQGEGLIIKPCCSVHTFFMKFEIDVLFINSKNEIVALFENAKKNRILSIILSSKYVIELPSGTIIAKNIEKGDFVEMQK